ncbi:putative membrane fusion protein (MFP) component of efflux pump, membrane anchor protein YbhG [Yersinia frederiksenii]|uniref:Efflux transporter, RND family, MFP subunit n=2 Tax=Yersinia frederiksenii TaxID=29484 RepID=A0ABR4W1Y8_YERFR|nr:efflux RND transporter periplasmic adaptor subunit [Yersinia frederiksenii]ATM97414.1 secretion protein HlyD [Yersinia frederiksenii]EEQ16030.1 Secretion protein HlyD family protein [Yersinia frederiksenii ATCC 33641]KGA46398.1 efflux transporter, RND family, MFP subunit [Yersinia frederiksenii ATCC 33641]CFR01543.1 putative membrane fusion protein (MFP) component of efflux pump%2C membrane anchor protein YbhG [Yersinia frederiksenii]CNB77121.1 putative membrane fusion protein (MFP) compone
MKKKTLFTLLLVVVVISMAVLFRAHNQNLLLQGEVDAPEVIVSSKAKGRVIERHVERGDDVKEGQLLITLESPELMAQLAGLEAARDQAQAQLDESLHGVREESIRNLRASLAQAQAEYDNALHTYNRNNSVAAKGFISAAELEDSRRAKDTAYQQVQAAKANLDEGLHGDRIELRDKYAAAVRQAEEDLAQLKAQTDDLQVRAPVAGEVGPIPAEVGELLNASSPLLTLIRLPQAYFVFNLREDILADVHKGDKVSLRVPALKDKEIMAEVRYIAPLGDYATKRATRATGDFDLKTFEVRLYPAAPIEGLRPGMSTLWQWKE